jgi:glucose-1-phosphate thymidylyltransferase
MGWINSDQLAQLAEPLRKSGYGDYLLQLLEQDQLVRVDNRFEVQR